MAEPANVYVCVGGGGGGGETNYVFGQEVVVQDSVCPNRKVSHPTIRAQCHTHAPPHTYSVASMPWRAFARVMTLRWAQAQVNEGIGAQGEMFMHVSLTEIPRTVSGPRGSTGDAQPVVTPLKRIAHATTPCHRLIAPPSPRSSSVWTYMIVTDVREVQVHPKTVCV